jgi:hypothetical protein
MNRQLWSPADCRGSRCSMTDTTSALPWPEGHDENGFCKCGDHWLFHAYYGLACTLKTCGCQRFESQTLEGCA